MGGLDTAVYDNPKPPRQAGGTYDNGSQSPISVLPQDALFDDIIYDNKHESKETAEAKPAAAALGMDVKEEDSAAGLMSAVYDVPKPVAPESPLPTCAVATAAPLKQNGHDAPATKTSNGQATDAFNMSPFCQTLLPDTSPPTEADMSQLQDQHSCHSSSTSVNAPHNEPWFHGKLNRNVVEMTLLCDGDFLVRESANSPGQYVLSGRRGGKVKHLLLIDPEGVVRTKDRTFDSISHLVKYHMESGQPITSNDSELLLKKPIPCSSG